MRSIPGIPHLWTENVLLGLIVREAKRPLLPREFRLLHGFKSSRLRESTTASMSYPRKSKNLYEESAVGTLPSLESPIRTSEGRAVAGSEWLVAIGSIWDYIP